MQGCWKNLFNLVKLLCSLMLDVYLKSYNKKKSYANFSDVKLNHDLAEFWSLENKDDVKRIYLTVINKFNLKNIVAVIGNGAAINWNTLHEKQLNNNNKMTVIIIIIIVILIQTINKHYLLMHDNTKKYLIMK